MVMKNSKTPTDFMVATFSSHIHTREMEEVAIREHAKKGWEVHSFSTVRPSEKTETYITKYLLTRTN